MSNFLIRLLRLIWGLFLFALGIVITMKANMGYAPWEVFHAGIGKSMGLSIGMVSILTGLVVCILVIGMGERLGLGTVLNMVLIGVFIDVIASIGRIPLIQSGWLKLPMFLLGVLIISFASFFYMSSGFGAGPRDSLMVALTRRTGIAIGWCRGTIEIFAVIVGWMLGGMVGLGTIVFVLGIGVFVQWVFSILKFDATLIRHQTLSDTYQQIRGSIIPEK